MLTAEELLGAIPRGGSHPFPNYQCKGDYVPTCAQCKRFVLLSCYSETNHTETPERDKDFPHRITLYSNTRSVQVTTSFYLAGTLLVLLVSNLLLWEKVTSVTLCPSWDGSCHGTLKNMFDYALSLSYELQNQTAEMLSDFVSNSLTYAFLLMGTFLPETSPKSKCNSIMNHIL